MVNKTLNGCWLLVVNNLLIRPLLLEITFWGFCWIRMKSWDFMVLAVHWSVVPQVGALGHEPHRRLERNRQNQKKNGWMNWKGKTSYNNLRSKKNQPIKSVGATQWLCVIASNRVCTRWSSMGQPANHRNNWLLEPRCGSVWLKCTCIAKRHCNLLCFFWFRKVSIVKTAVYCNSTLFSKLFVGEGRHALCYIYLVQTPCSAG